MRPEDRLSPILYVIGDLALPIDEVLTKVQFLSPILYSIHYIGPVRFGFAHTYSKGPPN